MAGNTVPIHGKVCRVEKNGTLMEFTEGWKIDVEVDFDPTSRQGRNWKESLAGQAGWTGEFSGQLVLGNTEQKAIIDNIINATPGTKLTDMEFNLEDAGDYFSGDLFIRNVSIDAKVGEKVFFTAKILGNEEISLTLA